jgi:predicted nucleic-acid-binding Zn-ribbon protein
MFTDQQKNEIVGRLTERLQKYGLAPKCPMCGNQNFAIADAYLLNLLQSDLKSISLGGPTIPSIAIICTNCGFISQHALGSLDLLPKEEVVKEKAKEEQVKEGANDDKK